MSDGEETIIRRSKRTENCPRKRIASPSDDFDPDMATDPKKSLASSGESFPLQSRTDSAPSKRPNGVANQFTGKRPGNPTKKLVVRNLRGNIL